MSVDGTAVGVTRISPRPTGLPSNLQAFEGYSRETGDATAGYVTNVFEVDSSSLRRTLYYCITTVTLTSNYGTAMTVDLYKNSGEWEGVAAGISEFMVAGSTQVAPLVGTMVNLVASDKPLYLGMKTPGTPGTVVIGWVSNQDAKTFDVVIRGFVSEEPFVLPRFIGL